MKADWSAAKYPSNNSGGWAGAMQSRPTQPHAAAGFLFLLLLFLFTTLAQAAGEAASVISISGTVSAQRADGKLRVLGKDSVVYVGEIVMTEKASAARLRFTDGGEITLRPTTRLVVEDHRFDQNKPADDATVLNLLKGGMRAVTGLVGKRGNQDAYQTRTTAATIGIRGTDYALLVCLPGDGGCAAFSLPEEFAQTATDLPPGLYIAVFDGEIAASNQAATRNFPAGRSAFIRDNSTPPLELARDPGLGRAFRVLRGTPATPRQSEADQGSPAGEGQAAQGGQSGQSDQGSTCLVR